MDGMPAILEQMTAESFSLKDIQLDMRVKLEAMADLRRLDVSFRQLSNAFQVPKEWVIFERASILTLGGCTRSEVNSEAREAGQETREAAREAGQEAREAGRDEESRAASPDSPPLQPLHRPPARRTPDRGRNTRG